MLSFISSLIALMQILLNDKPFRLYVSFISRAYVNGKKISGNKPHNVILG